jgi:hypothetical protein
MVLAIGVLGVLAVLALVIVSIAVSEKKTESAQYSADRAFYSADAASEAGIAWIRMQSSPPSVMDANKNVYLAGGYTLLSGDHNYKYDIRFVRKHYRPGWSLDYKDFEYVIQAQGASAQQSEAKIEVNAMRLYREGY